jgi:hypothetical protein
LILAGFKSPNIQLAFDPYLQYVALIGDSDRVASEFGPGVTNDALETKTTTCQIQCLCDDRELLPAQLVAQMQRGGPIKKRARMMSASSPNSHT